jgi:hypothetical protein
VVVAEVLDLEVVGVQAEVGLVVIEILILLNHQVVVEVVKHL